MNQYEFQSPSQDFITSINQEITYFEPEIAAQIYYEPSLGSLALKHDEGVQLILFRGQTPISNTHPKPYELLNRSSEELGSRNTVAGRGLYLGNTPQSVSVFATKESGREIAVFATPPVSSDDIAVFASEDDLYVTRAKAFNKEFKIFIQGFLTPHAKRLQKIEQAYEDKKLVVLNMHNGTRLAQTLQMERHNHPIRPLWYLWRDMDSQFIRIGTASRQLSLRRMIQKVSKRINT